MDVLVFSAEANFSLFTQSFSSVLGIAKEERGVKKVCFMMVHFDGQKRSEQNERNLKNSLQEIQFIFFHAGFRLDFFFVLLKN